MQNSSEPSTESSPVKIDTSVDPKASKSAPSRLAAFKNGVLFNVLIPLGLLACAGAAVVMLGTVEPATRPSTDTTRDGRLKALPPVRVQQLQSLEQTGQPLRLQVDGTVVPYREARVAAEIAGKVVFKAVECEAGSYVTAGQLLMKIDATDYELEVDRLTRMKEQDYQALREVDQEMANAKRSIEVAKQDLALQQKEVDRQNAMPAGYASRAEIDQANRALLASRQQLVNFENQFDLLVQRRIRLESSERLADTQLRGAETNLARTEIRAPIEGVIVAEEADLNTFVSRGTTLVVIDDTSKVDVSSSLRMDQLYWVLNQGNETVDTASRNYDLPETPAIIEYEMSGRDNVVYRWNGRLLSYNGIGLDPTTRTVPVRVVVDNPQEMVDENGKPITKTGTPALVRGMYVRVKLMIKPKASLVVIPARALQPGNRVFQFMPDESVLETTETEVTGDLADDGFNAKRWEPGKVIVRRSVVPVDTLTLGNVSGSQQTLSTDTNASGDRVSAFEGANRMWVCEVQSPELVSGSYVVVSPLGGFDDGSMPVRAERLDGDGAAPADADQSVASRAKNTEGA
ncbi:efflux RND transporter periplasmic adaptor subunit [Rubripirellula reticaptiva]|uniref:Multidrug resistance protein MdtA n=1 Tax=Rubripirellula reticaptiva TaxID=2528013 RepID=A0A5C6EE08_9BACT|nr:HlyD family efflux transporter periplasmic adaptor subunit [Rubripirellula reticaptiva]TWU47983.1 Multidrug resistance protein MdtA precursor [Rubripirellula reticaptiva]